MARTYKGLNDISCWQWWWWWWWWQWWWVSMVNTNQFTWADDHHVDDSLAMVSLRIDILFASTVHTNSLICYPSHSLHNSPGLHGVFRSPPNQIRLQSIFTMAENCLLIAEICDCRRTWRTLLSPHIPHLCPRENLTTVQWLWSLIMSMPVSTSLQI